jgi:hypothetical protein
MDVATTAKRQIGILDFLGGVPLSAYGRAPKVSSGRFSWSSPTLLWQDAC